MNILQWVKTHTFSRLTIYLFLCCCSIHALPYLQGRVVLNGDTAGIDSVRVVSKKFRVSTFTDKNGYYLIDKQPDTTCLPETTSVDTAYTHAVKLSLWNKPHTYSSIDGQPLPFSLYDLKGRLITPKKHAPANRQFSSKNLSNGLFLMSTDGSKAFPALVLDHFQGERRSTSRTQLFYPECITNDTIYFCKPGYTTVVLASNRPSSSEPQQMDKTEWSAFDIHNHTILTDGMYPLDTMLAQAFNNFALDLYANSEHGGTFATDTNGLTIKSNPFHTKAPAPYFDMYVSRWYSLTHFAWPKVQNQRKLYPDTRVLLGVEWNSPTHEHVSIGFINDADQPAAVADFEYRFDANDPDTSRGARLKQNLSHADAVAALSWLQTNYPSTSYCFINHPSREYSGPNTVEMFRDFHNAAPSVFLGLEGMPGHQKYYIRGKFDQMSKLTRGGADPVIAVIGGLWDALLGEGRRLWIIVNSDYHNSSQDFWPGEYAKTWATSSDTGAQAWLDGVRTGEMFAVHGDLLRDLDFSIDDGVHRATMGSDLATSRPTVQIEIRFRSPPVNHHGDSVRIDHIDLISGNITGKISPNDLTAYRNPTNSSSRLAARFFSNNWTVVNGWNVIRANVYCAKSTYFRLRGTSLPIGTPGEVDVEGNPLPDALYINTATTAWQDLWFYSNPIFVYRR